MKSVRIRSIRSILPISLYSVQMRENADQNNSEYGTFYAVLAYRKKTAMQLFNNYVSFKFLQKFLLEICCIVVFDISRTWFLFTEPVLQRCSEEKVFWKYAVNLQEDTHAEVRFQCSCSANLLKSHFGMGVLL